MPWLVSWCSSVVRGQVGCRVDEPISIKRYLLNTARKQWLIEDTGVTDLADCAANCWSAITSLPPLPIAHPTCKLFEDEQIGPA